MCTEEVTNQDPQSKRRSRPKEKKKLWGKEKEKKGYIMLFRQDIGILCSRRKNGFVQELSFMNYSENLFESGRSAEEVVNKLREEKKLEIPRA